jgi:transposase
MARIETVGMPVQVGPRAHRPPAGTAVVLAIDVSRSKLVYCLRWDGAEQRRLSTPAGIEHVQAIVEQYRSCCLHVVYEACGFGYALAWWLQQEGIRITVIAPSRVERAPGLAVKTDGLDVGKMARKLEEGQLHSIYIPPPELHQRRQLGRTYAQCVKERKRAQIRLRSLLQEQGRLGPPPTAGWTAYTRWLARQALPVPIERCAQSLERVRAVAHEEAKRLHRELRQLGRHPDYARLTTALCAQPGVGALSAIRLILELGTMDRFPSTDSLPRYLGLTPSEYSSGEVVRRGHILKCGPGALRALLLQCAWAAVRKAKDPKLTAVFTRLAPRIGRKRAIIAVARRLAIAVRRNWLAVLPDAPEEATPTLTV